MKNYLFIHWRSVVLVSLAAATIILCSWFPNAGRNSQVGLYMWLPEDTFELKGRSVSVSSQEADTLPEDTTYLKMAYLEKFKPPEVARYRQMSATLILSGNDRRSLHEPEICLDGQGWKIEKREVDVVSTLGGDLEVMTLQLGRWAKKDGDFVTDENGERIRIQAIYVYWWVSAEGSTPHADERVVRTALNNMFRNLNDRWGYPSIMVPVDARFGSQEGLREARKRAFDFVSEYAPKFQKSLGANPSIVERGVKATY
jgi:hypothetical protein